jgi:hypothetical protein
MYKIISKEIFSRNTKDASEKYKYHLSNNDETCDVVALYWSGLNDPIVYDKRDDINVSSMSWWLSVPGYAVNKVNYMHRLIAIDIHKITNCTNDKYNVDHINEIKTDNRLKNLRMATQSEQNHNRKCRSDKLPPPIELQNEGIRELPRYVRWDNSEEKFVIEKHPVLLHEVATGIRKSACMSGTKSCKKTIIQKYQDILARLEELNETQSEEDFELMKDKLYAEYQAIKKAVFEYEGVSFSEPSIVQNVYIHPERQSEKGRKSQSKLPQGCGVTIDMIPKYCYYRPATETRGDKFVIDRHAKLPNKKSWATTSSKAVSTIDKFKLLMQKLEEISNTTHTTS